MAQIERLILAELNRNGPLPPRWYVQYDSEQHCIRYRTRDDEHIYWYHPFSAEFVKAYPQTLLRPDPKREACEGALHPPHSYQAGEWKWHEKSEGYAAAIRDAFNCINKQDYVLAGEIAARVTSIKNDSTVDERPQEFYHPQDRPTVYRNSQALDSEVDAAMLARSLGYSLAIIVVEDFSPLQLLDPETATPKVQARWSLGDGYELWPPLYVGHFLGSWFAVKLYDETEYEFWDSSRYDWARKAAQFRQHELNISQEDLIKIAVTVQRHVRAGFSGGRPSLDDLIVYYYQQSQQGMSAFQTLEGWQQRTARLQTDILTVEWVTHAIACGNDEAAKKIADAFDVAYAAKARLMTGRPCDWYEEAAKSLASQHKDQGNSGPVEETLTTEKPASFAPLDTSRETLVFGGLAAESAVRWRPSLISSMPTFKISVRQNHFTGNQSYQNQQTRKRAQGSGRPLPALTRHGLPAHLYSENHLEEEYEFDLTDMEVFAIQEVDRSSEKLKELMGYLGVAIPADGIFGLIQWRMKEGLRASRTRLQASNFSPDSAQVNCRDLLMQRQSYVFTAVISLRKEHLKKAFQRYMGLVNVDRYLTPDGKPRNDWYLSRFPEYSPHAPNRFHEYQQRPTLALPIPPWLVHSGQDGKPTYAPVYRTDGSLVSRKTFANISSYETHFMSALLYDRDERNALQTQQYSYRFEYPARVQELADGQYSFDIQIKGDSVALGGQKLIPHIGNEITVFIVGLSDRSNEETQLKGRVFDAVMDGHDFKVVATGAGGIRKDAMHRLCMQGSAKVHVIWRDRDPDNARKIAAVMEACNLIRKQQSPFLLSQIGGKPRGKFSLRNILLDQEVDIWAPNLANHLIANYHNETVTWEEATEIAVSMIDVCSLNAEQQKFFNAALAGPYANTLILEGVPGSGKTTCLAALVIAVMRMGAKVLVSSSSNSGASALFDQVTKLIDSRRDIRDLGDQCVRYRSNVVEELALEQMESALPPDPLRQDRQNYSMAARIHEHIQHNPEDPIVRDFQNHIQARRLGERPASMNSFKTVITLLQQRVLNDCLLVGATAFMSTNLHELNYDAHILIFDEASQATEPDLLMVTAAQPDLLLVVLAGDLKKLGPVVPSHSNNRNPYGNVLATSPLRRFQAAYPQIQSMMLHRNYRAHPSLIEMPSDLFYDGSMVAASADQDEWDTNLGRNVRSMLTGPDFAGAFWDREAAFSRDNRQFFLKVDGSPVREENGTSWRNERGVAAVVAIAKRLTTTCKVAPSDIGIISMYREDVRYLKE